MIKKIVQITNTGKFRNCKPKGDVEFRKLTLIYAENGRGKTTLCDVLRSLRTGEGAVIEGRSTLGQTGRPSIDIRLDESNTRYENNRWSTVIPNIYIYDSKFVHENVYSGEVVDHAQKRNLLRVIVGEKGVSLAKRVDELDDSIRVAGQTLKDTKSEVKKYCSTVMTVEEFVALVADEDIDQKIASKETELIALRRSGEIASKPILNSIKIPRLPTTLPTVLAKTIDDVSNVTERLVRDHLESHTKGGSQKWLAMGISFIKDDDCPFCQQNIDNNELISAYKVYFGEAYDNLKNEVARLRDEVSSFGDESSRLVINQSRERNNELVEFWQEFIQFDVPSFSIDDFINSMIALRSETLSAVDSKAESILEATTLDEVFESLSINYENEVALIEAYNLSVNEVNSLITTKKAETAITNIERSEEELKKLKLIKARQNNDSITACDNYNAALEQKSSLETERGQAKESLENFTNDLLDVFQTNINKYLRMVTAGFQIIKVAQEYTGRKPRTSYQVLINNTPVKLGDDKTPDSEPSFRNTLSAGDRSTLALAFFLAQLETDAELEHKLVIFDDPFTSQDLSRRTWTQQRIRRLVDKANQIIVFSHEPTFLQLLFKGVSQGDVKTLQLTRMGGDNSTITPWDIENESLTDFHKDQLALQEFLNDGKGQAIDVVRAIRPVLEGYLRAKFLEAFNDNEWLGDFINKIREANPDDILYAAQEILEELEDINDYSKKYHHSGNICTVETEQISDSELQQFVRRTLELVGGY